VFELAKYGDTWDSVRLMIESPDDPSYYSDAPLVGSNPREAILSPSVGGLYTVTATFPGPPPLFYDARDLQCRVSVCT
jgi:hypothetical protein